MQSLLKTAIKQLNTRATLDSFNWNDLHYEQLVKIRFKMINNNLSFHTINATLSAGP